MTRTEVGRSPKSYTIVSDITGSLLLHTYRNQTHFGGFAWIAGGLKVERVSARDSPTKAAKIPYDLLQLQAAYLSQPTSREVTGHKGSERSQPTRVKLRNSGDSQKFGVASLLGPPKKWLPNVALHTQAMANFIGFIQD